MISQFSPSPNLCTSIYALDFLWGFVNLNTLNIGQWYRISWLRNGSPTPLKRMLLGLEFSMI